MRIAFTGAHGVGKTSLVRSVTRMLGGHSVAVYREPARLVAERAGDPTFFWRANNSPLRQLLIFIEHAVEERRVAEHSAITISDRTFVDHLAYTLVLFPALSNSPEMAVLRELSFETLGQYDHIFFVPIEFDLESDGVREADPYFQQAISDALLALYSDAGVGLVTVRGSLDQRTRQALRHIRRV